MMTKFLIFFLFFAFICVFSQKISGEYYPIESKCKLYLKIDCKNNFVFSTIGNKKIKGTVKVLKEDDVTYLDFDNLSSMFANDTIYIQNSGNSINPYLHFKECDEKFIHLVKRKKERKILQNNSSGKKNNF
ncbi:hypothetical protein AB671_00496 [Chryseobacterium sp. BGARF1]|uniref:hypothetical protein n=1 Tax=Chryseobacterium sp. BGARF1 TaxID=1664319 RepID=UPI0008054127|nr:hypothetical protein [Chryseobacterium sp. BGARF1]OBW47373.1 hypothetical protein AB671_00496 [Chryseobacterium sp. BGARF1]